MSPKKGQKKQTEKQTMSPQDWKTRGKYGRLTLWWTKFHHVLQKLLSGQNPDILIAEMNREGMS